MKRLVLAILFVLSLAVGTEAQTFRGTILGTVTDTSGLAVAGATVTVKNTETGLVRTSQSADDGSYTVTELPIGTYTVTITQGGFQTSVTRDVVVNVAGERRVDVALKTGQV
jgi:Carboxypeptidase regulatory-like domain